MSKAAILRAIHEVLTGTIGTIRTVPAGTVRAGAWDKISDEKLAADALVRARFEVEPIEDVDSGAIAPSTAPLVVDRFSVRVRLGFSPAKTTGELDEETRRAARVAIWDELKRCQDALGFAGNLVQDSTAAPTNLVGAALEPAGPARIVREDWALRIVVGEFVMHGWINRARAVA